jgi:DNA polymerase I
MSDKPIFLLFDGNALVHRAFHALPPLTVHKTGEMINGVKGFTQTLLKVIKDMKPTYWAISFDRPTPTFRHIKFTAYKEHRPATPDELKTQLKRAHEVCEAFHIPIFEIDGFEADDVLATLGSKACREEVNSIIVTGDNDLLQVVSDCIKVLTPRRGFADTVLYGEPEIEARYGLKAGQLIDLKTLVGDTSDNVPGIKGVGEKTAVKLLLQFGSVEKMYESLDLVTPEKLQASLRENRDNVLRNRELVTIVRDTPIDFHLEDCKVSAYDRQQVLKLFQELEFVSLLGQLPQEFEQSVPAAPAQVQTLEKQYEIVSSMDALKQLADNLSSCDEFSYDLETSGLNEMTTDIVDFSFSHGEGKAYCIPVGHRGLSSVPQIPLPEVINVLKPVLETRRSHKIAHNGKFDSLVLAQHGIEVENLAFDTMIAAYVLGEKSLTLKALAFNKFGVEMTLITDLIGTGSKQKTMAEVELEAAAEYSCADADITYRLKKLLHDDLHKQGLWNLFSEIEMPLVPVLMSMERIGVCIDTQLLQDMSNSMGADMARIEKEIYDCVGHQFNINSSQQLSQILFEDLQMPKPKKTTKGYSTDASVLEELKGAHPVIDLILKYRQLSKLKSTYTDAFLSLINPQTGRLHTSFNQCGTTTGRLSSSDPNLQNLPIRTELGSRIRQAIIPRQGWLMMSADYSQIDLRALAHISEDPALIETFLKDEDVHRTTASLVFNVPPDQVTSEMRRNAKTVNFGVIYGMSDYGLEQATTFNREEAGGFIKAYFEKYPKVSEYFENTKEQARRLGYVQTVMGRRRYIPEVNSPNRQVRESAERMAINMPVQGTSADIIKIAMIDIFKEINDRKWQSRMLLQVHDELVFEIAPGEEEEMKKMVTAKMHHALELKVPLKVDIKLGKNWGETK